MVPGVETGHPLAPIHLANDAGASTAAQSSEMQGEGMPLHFLSIMSRLIRF